MNLKNKSILLMGMGISNMSVARWLLEKGAKLITLTDEKFLDKLPEEIQKSYKRLLHKYEGRQKTVFMGRFGTHDPDDFADADLVIKQPSIRDDNQYLKLTNVPIETDISLFFKLCPSKKIIGVTGSKGKTTTATFLYELLKAHGHKAVLGGNMGIPVFDILDKIDKDTWVVLEISSYMAESLAKHKLAPKYVILTSLFNEHQNHYKSYEEYVKAKIEWLQYQKEEDCVLMQHDVSIPTNVYDSLGEKAKWILYTGKSFPENIKLKYKGDHHKQNLCAGLTFMENLLKLDTAIARKVIKDFKIEHRMEYLGEKNGREFINNAMAVNPTTFRRDLEVVLEANKPIFMIVGGGDKNLDIESIAKTINETPQIIDVVVLDSEKGETPEQFISSLDLAKLVGAFGKGEMKEAFEALYKESKEGSIIFFNPGFTGFARGKEFKKLVKNLKTGGDA